MNRSQLLCLACVVFTILTFVNYRLHVYDVASDANVVNCKAIGGRNLSLRQGIQNDMATKPKVSASLPLTVDAPNIRSCGLTLFTTAPGNSRRPVVFQNTVDNWPLLMKWNVTLILYTDDRELCERAKRSGWLCLPVLRYVSVNVRPVLSSMFLHAMLTRRGCLYGFVNADILFDDSIIYSLDAILSHSAFNNFSSESPLFVTSRRTRVTGVTPAEAVNIEALRKKTKTFGVRDTEWAADIFITSSNYPWVTIPEIAVGLPNFDNWVILRSNQLTEKTVDISDTTMVVHQSTSTDDLDRIRKDEAYNRRLITETLGPYSDQPGRIICTYFMSLRNSRNEITFVKRKRDRLCTDGPVLHV